eukprot:5544367-Prymnesium_polylepis.1
MGWTTFAGATRSWSMRARRRSRCAGSTPRAASRRRTSDTRGMRACTPRPMASCTLSGCERMANGRRGGRSTFRASTRTRCASLTGRHCASGEAATSAGATTPPGRQRSMRRRTPRAR